MSDPNFICHFLDRAAFSAAEDKRMALAKAREADPAWMAANKATYGWARLDEVVAPCAMWHVPWYFDPANPKCAPKREKALAAIAAAPDVKYGHLANRYWLEWSDKRPPIAVLCPNGREWVVDANSSNGDGWTVTGEPPLLTCAPSIQVPGYHGFLRDGVFTPNM